jgi:hypothetical protein
MKINWRFFKNGSLRLAGALAIGAAVMLSSCSDSSNKGESEYGGGPYSNDAPSEQTTAGQASGGTGAAPSTDVATTSSTTGAAAPGGSAVQSDQGMDETYGPEYGTTTGIANSPVGQGAVSPGDTMSGGGMNGESDTMPASETTSATGAAVTGSGTTTGQGSGQGTSRTATTGSAGEGTGGTGSGSGASTQQDQRERAVENNRPQTDTLQNRRP